MSKGNLILRNDTFFGVCEGLGQDFGFHANWLRIAFAAGFYFNPTIVIGTYLGLGVLVATSRFLIPDCTAHAPLQLVEGETIYEEQLQLAA